MTVVIRPVAINDVDAAASVHLQTALSAYASIFPDHAPKPTIGDMRRTWREIVGEGRGWKAVEGDRVVGVAGLLPTAHGYEMKAVYVDPGRAGRGIGSRLVERVEAVALAEGLMPLRLWVLEDNEAVRCWYERRGWTQVEGRRTVWEDIDDVRYQFGGGPGA